MLNYNKYQEIFTAHSHIYTLAGVSIILVCRVFTLPVPVSLQSTRRRETGNEVEVHVNTSIHDAF